MADFMRLADLCLIYAEAYNEYYGPVATIYNYLNLIRARAGIPTIEESKQIYREWEWEEPAADEFCRTKILDDGNPLTVKAMKNIINKGRDFGWGE